MQYSPLTYLLKVLCTETSLKLGVRFAQGCLIKGILNSTDPTEKLFRATVLRSSVVLKCQDF